MHNRTAVLAVLLHLPALVAADTGPSAARLAKDLRPGHPRLIALKADLDRVRKLVKEHAQAADLQKGVVSAAEGLLDAPTIEHRLIGPRLLSQSRDCLSKVYTLATAYRLTGDKRFAKRAEKEMLTAAGFKDWNPSHFLDTAEMAHALAIGYDWLFDVLSPETRAAVRTAIVDKGLKPALDVYEKKRWWAVARHNWSQVCNGGIGIAALAIADEEPQLANRILEYAIASIRLPLAELAPDGGWAEGPGYWHYAMRYTAYFLAAMETAVGSDYGLGSMPGMAETGMFRMHFIGPTGLTFNYADAGAGAGGAPEMFYFARRYERPVYAWHQRRFRQRTDPLDLWWFDPRGTDEQGFGLARDAHFKNIQVTFFRSDWKDPDALFVGFKGGDNKANHSHLDLGSFVLDALGQRWAVDLGPDDYNMPGYFGSKRWTYGRLRTDGHNTLVINGDNQDPKAAASITSFRSTPDAAFAVADLSAAYAKHARGVRRGLMVLDRRRVLIQDEIDAEAGVEIEWGFMTQAEVDIEGPKATLTLKGRKLTLEAMTTAGGELAVKEYTLEPPQRPVKDTRRITLKCRTADGTTRLAILATPLEGREPQERLKLRSLAEWAASQ